MDEVFNMISYSNTCTYTY